MSLHDPAQSRLVRAVQTARKRRRGLFPDGLFSDPAWEILLELYAVHLDQLRTSITSVCAASSVPTTTALRWVAKLEQDGIVVRVDDPLDARRSWIALTPGGLERMRTYFETLPLSASS